MIIAMSMGTLFGLLNNSAKCRIILYHVLNEVILRGTYKIYHMRYSNDRYLKKYYKFFCKV